MKILNLYIKPNNVVMNDKRVTKKQNTWFLAINWDLCTK